MPTSPYNDLDAELPFKKAIKLDKALIKRICNLIMAGNRIETAYLVCGVSRAQFSIWCERARGRPKTIYGMLVDNLQTAVAIADIRDLQVIDRAAQKEWKAAAWRLERRSHKHFGQRQTVEHTGVVDAAPQVVITIPANGSERKDT